MLPHGSQTGETSITKIIKTLHRNRIKWGGLDYLLGLLNYSGYWSDFSSSSPKVLDCVCVNNVRPNDAMISSKTMRHMFIPENRTLLYSVLLLCYFFSWDRLCLECFAEGKTQNRKQNYSLTFRENPWSKQPRLPWKLPSGRWRRFEVQPFLYNLAYSIPAFVFMALLVLLSFHQRRAEMLVVCFLVLIKPTFDFQTMHIPFQGKTPKPPPN